MRSVSGLVQTSMSLMHCRFLRIPSSTSPDGGKNFLLEKAACRAGPSGDPDGILSVSGADGTAGELRPDLLLNPESDRSGFTLITDQQSWLHTSESLDDLIWTSGSSGRVPALLVWGVTEDLRPVPLIRRPPCLCFFTPSSEEPESSELPS